MMTSRAFEASRTLILAAFLMEGALTFNFQPVVKTLRLSSIRLFMTITTHVEPPEELHPWPSTTDGDDVKHDVEPPLVDVFPYETPLSQIHKREQSYSQVKTVHYLRHAQGAHNVNKEYRSSRNIDARLTEVGLEQCRALAEQIRTAPDGSPLSALLQHAQLCVTSPLTRCIQTTLCSLEPLLFDGEQGATDPEVKVPVVAHESIRETVNYNCDRRRHIDEIVRDFPRVDLSQIQPQHDALWEQYLERLGCAESYPHHRESAEIHKVADRGRAFLRWLSQRPEDHIVVCSHAAFSRCLWNFGQVGHVPLLPSQDLDVRPPGAKNPPIVQYCGPMDFEESIRADYDNCELRSMLFAFRC